MFALRFPQAPGPRDSPVSLVNKARLSERQAGNSGSRIQDTCNGRGVLPGERRRRRREREADLRCEESDTASQTGKEVELSDKNDSVPCVPK